MADVPPGVAPAVAALRAGGCVVLPTDTVYGVAVRAERPGAAAVLAGLKGRPAEQALAVLVSDAEQALRWCAGVTPEVRRLVDRCWPGPLTLVVRRSPAAAHLDLGGDPATIGVRCPDSGVVQAIAREVGPLATTSANRHGAPTPSAAAQAAAALLGPVDVVVDGGPLHGEASTVVDCTRPAWRMLRQGTLTFDDLVQASA
ncbi:MAG: threonylcarbamoyl-AMP synthase [Actinobacteria bacterium]|nr:threonylcarbamoyl-AMP synthase [Actinomycetota bacterium]